MFRQISKGVMLTRSKSVNGLARVGRRSLTTQLQNKMKVQKEVISCQDLNEFPADSAGFVRSSIFGDQIEVEKCSVADYVWSNVNGWWDKTAVVSISKLF